MSISFNHPDNIVTSTSALQLTVSSGSTTSPQPIRLDSTSVIMPVRALPTGEAGAVVFDTGSKTMKYHDGTSWVELLGRDVILEPIYLQIDNINTQLANRVATVTYSTSSIPTAAISGTNLNIVFPTPSTSTSTNGLFTSTPPGSIMHYSLTSGQSIASIREQMSGASGGQSGRTGTAANPYLSKTGWCLADGNYWTWVGSTGTITKQVPALNNTASYLKSIGTDGITKTDAAIAGSGTTDATVLSVAQLPSHNFSVSGSTSADGSHNHSVPVERANDGLYGPSVIRGVYWPGGYTKITTQAGSSTEGLHTHTFSGTTNTIGSNQGHSHNLSSLDVAHYNVAVLYNIAEPSVALNQDAGDARYVLKSGDTMTGSLSIANSATIAANDTSLPLYFRNSSGGERAAIYHSSSTNTLRLRSAGGSEVSINTSGLLTAPSLAVTADSATVNGKNVVRSVNGTVANAAGNVTLTTATASLTETGWWKDASTGMIYQWGYVTPKGSDVSVTFPVAFSSACFSVTLGQIYSTHSSQTQVARLMSKATTTGCVIYTGADETGVYWQAIGV